MCFYELMIEHFVNGNFPIAGDAGNCDPKIDSKKDFHENLNFPSIENERKT